MSFNRGVNKKKKKVKLKTRLFLAFAVFAIVVSLTLALFAQFILFPILVKEKNGSAFDITETCSYFIDGDDINGYVSTNTIDDNYKKVYDRLKKIQGLESIKYAYVVYISADTVKYIWSIDEGKSDEENYRNLGTSEDGIAKEEFDLLASHEEVTPNNAIVTNSDQYGYIATLYSNIYDSSGKVVAQVGVDIDLNKVNHIVLLQLAALFSIIIVCILIFLFSLSLYMGQKIVKPINEISDKISSFAMNGTNNSVRLNFEPIKIKTNDELQILAESFNMMVLEINDYIENLYRVTKEKERIHSELSVASSIQANMLPCIFPAFPKRNDIDIYATMHPAKEVGGDFYDYFFIDEDHVVFLVGDVSGKGVAAALFMVIAKTLLKNEAQSLKIINETLIKVNNQLCDNNKEEMFVTAFAAVFNVKTGELVYSNAGHNKPLIYRAKEKKFDWLHMKKGFVLAGIENFKYRLEKTYLDKGDAIYIYTDGVTEALNKKNELFSDSRLLECMNSLDFDDMKLEDVLKFVADEIKKFANGADQADDITMLLFKNYTVDYKGDEQDDGEKVNKS